MTDLGEGWHHWRRLFRRTEREVDDELTFHFDQRIAELRASGLDANGARQRAEAEFGDRASVRRDLLHIDRQVARRRRWRERMEWITQDLGYVFRSLRRSPGFVITVVLTLAIGLGANVAIFSILDRLFLSPPPGIATPDGLRRVVAIQPPRAAMFGAATGSAGGAPAIQSVFPYPSFAALVQGISSVQFTGYDQNTLTMDDSLGTVSVGASGVLADYFTVLGVRPQVGRFFATSELRPEVPAFAVVLGDHLWRSRYGANRDVIGRVIDLDGRPFTIIGVAPPDFHGPDNDAVQLWMPMNTEESFGGRAWYVGTNTYWIRILARPPTGLSDQRFQALATNVFRHGGAVRDSNLTARITPLVAPLANEFDSKEMTIATHLSGVAIILLLISCANIANLLLARGRSRRREIGVRLALGVSRRRLVGLLLSESLVVATLGAAAGLLIAWWGAGILRQMILPHTTWADATVNWHVLWFTVAIAVVTGLLAGLAPAWQLSRPDVVHMLKGGDRNPVQSGRGTRSALLIAQTALSVVLLAAAGVFLRSLNRVVNAPIGFDRDQVLFVSIAPQRGHESARADIARRLPGIGQELQRLPGVERTALADHMPMWAISFTNWYIPGRDTTGMFGPEGPSFMHVSPGFFATVGMHLLRGHDFERGNLLANADAVVVNREMAQKLWPGVDPLAQCLIINDRNSPCRPVIGVVSNTHTANVIEGASMHFYLPVADTGGRGKGGVIAVRTSPGHTTQVASEIARTLAPRFSGIADVNVRPMNSIVASEFRPWQTGAALFAVAALLALIVAAVGIYSTVSYVFSQRLRELGVRLALGAARRHVIWLVLWEGLHTVLIGVAVGLGLAWVSGRLVESMLYQTSAHDPAILSLVAIVLVGVAALASLIPAVRAIRVDPAITLRAE